MSQYCRNQSPVNWEAPVPIIVVPGPWSEDDIQYQVENIPDHEIS